MEILQPLGISGSCMWLVKSITQDWSDSKFWMLYNILYQLCLPMEKLRMACALTTPAHWGLNIIWQKPARHVFLSWWISVGVWFWTVGKSWLHDIAWTISRSLAIMISFDLCSWKFSPPDFLCYHVNVPHLFVPTLLAKSDDTIDKVWARSKLQIPHRPKRCPRPGVSFSMFHRFITKRHHEVSWNEKGWRKYVYTGITEVWFCNND